MVQVKPLNRAGNIPGPNTTETKQFGFTSSWKCIKASVEIHDPKDQKYATVSVRNKQNLNTLA